MPQLDPASFAPQLIWLAITFLLLYGLMAKLALPAVGKVLEHRKARIDSDLSDAGRLKSEADQVFAAYERALNEARLEAQNQIRATMEQLNSEAATRQHEVMARLAAETAEAEARIGEAKTAGLANLQGLAVDIARDAAAKLVGFRPDQDAAILAVGAAVKERA